MAEVFRRIAFNLSYLFHPRWDTGIPAPELVCYIAGRTPGNALDIGCGTGTNLLHLARQGWRVTGIDFAPLAIAKARRKLRDYQVTLRVGNVTKLTGLALPGLYDLGLDMGCFHSLAPDERPAYVKGVEKWIRPEGVLLIYAFQPAQSNPGRGISREEMLGCFKDSFELVNYEQGMGRPSAWYTFRRREG